MTETLGLSRWPRTVALAFAFVLALAFGFVLLSLIQGNAAGATTVDETVVPTSVEPTDAVTPPVTEPEPTPAELTEPVEPAPAPAAEAVEPVPGEETTTTPVAEQPKAPVAPVSSQIVAPPATRPAPADAGAEVLAAPLPDQAEPPAALTERARVQPLRADRSGPAFGAVLDRTTPASGGLVGEEPGGPAPIKSQDRSAPLAPGPAPASTVTGGELAQNLRTAGNTLLVAALFAAASLVLSRTWRLIVHDRHLALPVVLTAVARPG